jgi:hypothetical protein
MPRALRRRATASAHCRSSAALPFSTKPYLLTSSQHHAWVAAGSTAVGHVLPDNIRLRCFSVLISTVVQHLCVIANLGRSTVQAAIPPRYLGAGLARRPHALHGERAAVCQGALGRAMRRDDVMRQLLHPPARPEPCSFLKPCLVGPERPPPPSTAHPDATL